MSLFVSKKRSQPPSDWRRRSVAARRLVLLLFVLSPTALLARPPAIELFSEERSLAILPLRNDSGLDQLNYLREGIVKMLASRLEAIAYLQGVERSPTLLVRTARDQDSDVRWMRLRLRTRLIRLDEDVERWIQLAQPAEQARRASADLLLRGAFRFADGDAAPPERRPRSLWLRGRPLRIDLELFDARQAKSERIIIETNIEEVYRALPDAADRLASILSAGATPFAVRTAQEGALVYLDDQFIGRSPLAARAPPGPYRLRVEMEGFQTVERELQLRADAENAHFVELSPRRDGAGLRVASDPPGASVYLNHQLLGETPLFRDDLPAGAHRLRIESEGRPTLYIGIELRDGQVLEVTRPLPAADAGPRSAYRLLDWSDLDLAFYSALGSLGGYAGYAYFDVRRERALDRSLAVYPLLGVWQLNQQFPDALSFAYGWQRLQRDQAAANREARFSRWSAGLGILSLLAAGVFLYVDLSAIDDDTSGELGWFVGLEAGAGPAYPMNDSSKNRWNDLNDAQWRMGLNARF